MKVILFISIVLFIRCESSVNEIKKDSRESLEFTSINIPDGYVQIDTLTFIVFRSKNDEDKFFNVNEIKSSQPFPIINYNQKDVVGICIGVSQSTDTYVTIDSLVLVNRSKIYVYSTKHFIVDIFAAIDYPLHFVSVDKYNVDIEFNEPIVVRH